MVRDLTALVSELGHPDWVVDVADGGAVILGPATPKERALAESAAATVPGVTRIRTHSQQPHTEE
ncbi:MAG TPA: hypothetical protein VIP58_17090, partial [Nocardioides sp.]